MRDYQIKTEPFQYGSIFDLKIHKKVNEHSTAFISGSISRDMEEKYLNDITSNKDTAMKILAVEENGEEKVLFQGIVTGFRLGSVNGYKTLSLELKSATYLMDTSRHIRAFQDKEADYADLIAELMKGYENANYLMKEAHSKIQEFILQYQETDWEFIKRLAGRKQSFIVPADLYPGVRFYFGMPVQDVHDISESDEYQIQVTDGGYPCYIIKTRESYAIGNEIHFLSRKLYIEEIESSYEGKELVHTCYMKPKAGFFKDAAFNYLQIGASLDATVLEVEKDRVRIKIEKDENSSNSYEWWFPYSTVYSSPDGSGWYCMPEIGDRVRVYLPSEKENGAFVISAVHMEEGGLRDQPSKKFFRNREGKEIRLTPDAIMMTNNQGMSIELDDQKGILLTCDKSVLIKAIGDIDISSSESTLSLFAADSVKIMQGRTALIVDEDISFKGGKLKIQ